MENLRQEKSQMAEATSEPWGLFYPESYAPSPTLPVQSSLEVKQHFYPTNSEYYIKYELSG